MVLPLITIALPIYNVAPYVKESLLSALNQTYENIEIIAVDDKGTDNSMDIVRSVIASHPRGNIVRIIEHPRNLKTGATKNSALDNANGEYIYFMDSDDIIIPECIQIFYERMKETQVDVILGSHVQCKKNDPSNLLNIFTAPDCIIKEEQAILKYTRNLIREKYPVPMWNKLYDIKFIQKYNIRCIPHHLQEDPWFSFQVCLYASSFATINKITYKQIVHNSSQSFVPLGSYHLQQNKEICNSEIALMRRYTRLPKGVMNLYISRLKYLIPYIRGLNFTEQVKKQFCLDCTNIQEVNFKYKDIYGWDNKLLAFAYKTHSYFFIHHMHTLINKYYSFLRKRIY